MKAMKKAGGATGLTASVAFTTVAETTELKPKAVKAVVTNYLQLVATELKKNGKFKLGGVLNMKLKKKPAKAARKGVNPFTKELQQTESGDQLLAVGSLTSSSLVGCST